MELAALYSVLPMDVMKIEFIYRRHMKLFDTSLLPGKAEFFWIPQDSWFRISVKNCTVWLWTAHCTRTILSWSIYIMVFSVLRLGRTAAK